METVADILVDVAPVVGKFNRLVLGVEWERKQLTRFKGVISLAHDVGDCLDLPRRRIEQKLRSAANPPTVP